ncbi:MAG: type II toxin-antitoxin system RelE/ParE family toxin [Amaricoccus sp.]|uniref:type II toxin-antitoxin system RelE/ParE family toxin n=1 Tax=Amaricoccus sp. TaxID=1872485 RepID=UPI0039E4DE56
MTRLGYAQPALDDLRDILDYINESDPAAARRVLGAIRHVADLLPSNPKLGKRGRVRRTRELVVAGAPYIIVDQLSSDAIVVLAILHTARDLPRALRGRLTRREQIP